MSLQQLEKRHFDRLRPVKIQAISPEFKLEEIASDLTPNKTQRNRLPRILAGYAPPQEKGLLDELHSLFEDLLDFIQSPLLTPDEIRSFLNQGLELVGLEKNPFARGIVTSWAGTLSGLTAPQNLLIGLGLAVVPQLIPVAASAGLGASSKQIIQASKAGFEALKQGDSESAAHYFTDALTNVWMAVGSAGILKKSITSQPIRLRQISAATSSRVQANLALGEAVMVGTQEAVISAYLWRPNANP